MFSIWLSTISILSFRLPSHTQCLQKIIMFPREAEDSEITEDRYTVVGYHPLF